MHITGAPIPEPNRREMVRYLTNMQTPEGGWGIHIESLPTVLGTALNYAAMRLLVCAWGGRGRVRGRASERASGVLGGRGVLRRKVGCRACLGTMRGWFGRGSGWRHAVVVSASRPGASSG
jgi:hypothetical protein